VSHILTVAAVSSWQHSLAYALLCPPSCLGMVHPQVHGTYWGVICQALCSCTCAVNVICQALCSCTCAVNVFCQALCSCTCAVNAAKLISAATEPSDPAAAAAAAAAGAVACTGATAAAAVVAFARGRPRKGLVGESDPDYEVGKGGSKTSIAFIVACQRTVHASQCECWLVAAA